MKKGEESQADIDHKAYTEFGSVATAQFAVDKNFYTAIKTLDKGTKKYPYSINIIDMKYQYLVSAFNLVNNMWRSFDKKTLKIINKEFTFVQTSFKKTASDYKKVLKKYPKGQLKVSINQKIVLIDQYLNATKEALKRLKSMGTTFSKKPTKKVARKTKKTKKKKATKKVSKKPKVSYIR